MSRKPNPNARSFTTYIHNINTYNLINELMAKLGNNRTAVINEALDIGVRALYERVFGKDVETEKAAKSQHSPSVGRELKELRRNTDDVFVEMNIIETMVAGLFNVLAAQLNGEDVNAEALLDGSMCDLPELVAGLKDDLTRTEERNGQ